MSLRALLAVAAVSVPLFAFGAETVQRSGETIEVSIVNLDLIVTNKKTGQRVHGLTKNDFEVFEDGRPQAITNFAAYAPEPKSEVTSSKTTLTTAVAVPAEAPKRQRRTIAIFIERFHLAGGPVETIFDSLKKTLHEIVAPGDALLIATWDLRTEVRLDYTDDLKAIDATLDKIAKESATVSIDAIDNHMTEVNEVRAFYEEAAQSMLGSGATGMTIPPAEFQAAIQAEADNGAMQEKARMRAKAAAVNALISTMSNDDGRKVLLLMTHRFSQIAGAEFYYSISTGPGPLDGNIRAEHDTRNFLEAIKATANAHGVTIYALYPSGLESASLNGPTQKGIPTTETVLAQKSFNDQVLQNELAALDDVTKATGGTVAWGSMNIADALPRIRDDFDDYYSIAYRVTARNDNHVRRVSVRAKNGDYAVRTRTQYMEKTDDGTVRDRVVAALFRPATPGGIDVTATLGTRVPKSKTRYTVPVSIRVPVSSLMTNDEGGVAKGAFSVYIATGRLVGETSDITKQTVPFTVAELEKVKDGYFTYQFDLLTDFATNRLAIGVYDEVSHDSGFAQVDLYAPQKD